MPTYRTWPLAGLAAQIAVLAVLARTAGLGAAGWLTGAGFGLATAAGLTLGLHRAGRAGLGWADQVTLLRATLVGAVAALAADSFGRPVPVAGLVALASVALTLDGIDGWLARRTGTVTEFGARFDVEVDAFLLLVLSGYAAHPFGAWVLAIGAMRYAWVAASWVLAWLRGPLAPRRWRKVVAATQGVVLAVAAADVLPRPLVATALAVALALLSASFASCVGKLWPRRSVPAPQPERTAAYAA